MNSNPSGLEGGDRPAGPPRVAAGRELDRRELFAEKRAIRIAHDGEIYALRQVRLVKLILTK